MLAYFSYIYGVVLKFGTARIPHLIPFIMSYVLNSYKFEKKNLVGRQNLNTGVNDNLIHPQSSWFMSLWSASPIKNNAIWVCPICIKFMGLESPNYINSYGNQTHGWEFHETTWASEAFEWEEHRALGWVFQPCEIVRVYPIISQWLSHIHWTSLNKSLEIIVVRLDCIPLAPIVPLNYIPLHPIRSAYNKCPGITWYPNYCPHDLRTNPIKSLYIAINPYKTWCWC